MAHPHKPTLVDHGQCAMNGFFAVSASGMVCDCSTVQINLSIQSGIKVRLIKYKHQQNYNFNFLMILGQLILKVVKLLIIVP